MTGSAEDDTGWGWSPETWLTDLYQYINQTINHLGHFGRLEEIQEELNALLNETANAYINASLHNETHGNETHDKDHDEHDGTGDHSGGHNHPTAIFFIFSSCALGGKITSGTYSARH